MSYPLLILPFLAVVLLVVLATIRRPHFGRRMAASAIATVVLFLLTAVFDNLMIAADLFRYPEHLLSGVKVGLAPVEDFAYPLAAAFGVPAVWTLLGPRTAPPPPTPQEPTR